MKDAVMSQQNRFCISCSLPFNAYLLFNQHVQTGQITINIKYVLISNFNDETVISVFSLNLAMELWQANHHTTAYKRSVILNVLKTRP